MEHLVHIEEREVSINFELRQKCRTTLHLRNLMHTMPVAFKLQTTSPDKFSVRPPNGYILPLANYSIEIILKPQLELPVTIPFSQEKFVLKTALAGHATNGNLPGRVPDKWFSSPKIQVFVDARLKVVYVGPSLLRHCVASEDTFAVRQLLIRQTRASIPGDDGRTPLHIAASVGNLKIVDVLLQFGAAIDARDLQDRTPLWEAVSRGHLEVVKELLGRGADIQADDPTKGGHRCTVHISATLPSTKILEELIAHGANINIRDTEGRTALHYAVAAGQVESAWTLLHAGIDKNAQTEDGQTAIFMAADKGLLEVVQLLLESGVNTHIKAKNGKSPSEIAAQGDHMDIVKAIEAGEELLRAARRGDVQTVSTLLHDSSSKTAWACDSEGWTPLHVASFKGHAQIVHQLLLADRGAAALQQRDIEGHTPLHCAAEGGSMAVVELLLAMGADPLATSARGATPAELASALGFTPIAQLLKRRASKSKSAYPLEENLELGIKGFEKLYSLPRTRPNLESMSPGPNPPSLLSASFANPSPNHTAHLYASPTRSSMFRNINLSPKSTRKHQPHDKSGPLSDWHSLRTTSGPLLPMRVMSPEKKTQSTLQSQQHLLEEAFQQPSQSSKEELATALGASRFTKDRGTPEEVEAPVSPNPSQNTNCLQLKKAQTKAMQTTASILHLTNHANDQAYQQDLLSPGASLSVSPEQTPDHQPSLSAEQTQSPMSVNHDHLRGRVLERPLLTKSLQSHVSVTEQDHSTSLSTMGHVKNLALNKQQNRKSISPFHKMANITDTEALGYPSLKRWLRDGNDISNASFFLHQPSSSSSGGSSSYMSADEQIQRECDHRADKNLHGTVPLVSTTEKVSPNLTAWELPQVRKDSPLRLREGQSPRTPGKVARNGQNMASYSPPLTIKQMRKPMMSKHNQQDSESALQTEGVVGVQQAKARAVVTFRELFDRGTFGNAS